MRRGFDVDPGGGLNSVPVPSEPSRLSDLLRSNLWTAIASGHELRTAERDLPAQGRHGDDRQGHGQGSRPADQYNCKVTDIHQDESGVTVTYVDSRTGGEPRTATREMVHLHHSHARSSARFP